MKKLSIISLSILLALSLSVTAWAVADSATWTGTSPSTTIPVTGTYQAIGDGTPVYSVDITWGSMEFTYQASGGAWNPETHTYGEGSSGTWTCEDGANQITIKNHSNAYVNCDLKYTSIDSNITGNLSTNILTFGSAVNTPVDDPPTGTATLDLTGQLPSGSNEAEIGTVTITITGN